MTILVGALIAIVSLWLHELGHAVASRLYHDSFGERKLTWRPLVNLDPVFSIIVPIATAITSSGAFPVGMGRPFVLVKNRWQIALAGPLVNLALAVVLAFVWPQAATINFALGFINLLPIYPLDGWVVLHTIKE